MNLLRGEISFRKLYCAPHFSIKLIPAVSWPYGQYSQSTHLITRIHTIECKWEIVPNKYAVKLIMANIWAQIGCLSIGFLFVVETHLGGGSCAEIDKKKSDLGVTHLWCFWRCLLRRRWAHTFGCAPHYPWLIQFQQGSHWLINFVYVSNFNFNFNLSSNQTEHAVDRCVS